MRIVGESEIVVKVKVPEDWNAELVEVVRRKLIVDVVSELQKRIEEARKFEEIIKKAQINEKEAKKLELEIKEAVAKRYGAV